MVPCELVSYCNIIRRILDLLMSIMRNGGGDEVFLFYTFYAPRNSCQNYAKQITLFSFLQKEGRFYLFIFLYLGNNLFGEM